MLGGPVWRQLRHRASNRAEFLHQSAAVVFRPQRFDADTDFFVRDARVVWREGGIEVALVVFGAPFYCGLQKPFWQTVPPPRSTAPGGWPAPDTWAVTPSLLASVGGEAWSFSSIGSNVTE